MKGSVVVLGFLNDMLILGHLLNWMLLCSRLEKISSDIIGFLFSLLLEYIIVYEVYKEYKLRKLYNMNKSRLVSIVKLMLPIIVGSVLRMCGW